MSKTIYVRWRTCNCTDLVLGDGVIRTLLITHYPNLAHINKEPCSHWEVGEAEGYLDSDEVTSEHKTSKKASS